MKTHLFIPLLVLGILCQAQAQTLVTLANTGPRAERLNVVMLSEGYTAAELTSGKFTTDATTISNALLSEEPFASYRPFFNVYGIAIASAQSGADQGSAGGSVNTYFNATFNSYGIDRLLTINSAGYSKVTTLLNTYVPDYDIVLVVVNDSKYGGSGGSIAVTSTNASAPEIAIHEIGHSFANLGDEYDDPGSTPSETPNTTQQTNRNLIKWRAWINGATPVPTPEMSGYGNGIVGLFEGAAYRPTGWYRPTDDSKMNHLSVPFYAVNEEAIVLSIYRRISPITSVTPTASTVTVTQPGVTSTFTLSVPLTAGAAPRLTVQWLVDGVVVAGNTTNSLALLSDSLGNGTHTVLAKVNDPTTKVRTDTGGLLHEQRSWTLKLSNQGPPAPSLLTATALSNGHVKLAWQDNATNEGGFIIESAIGTAAFAQAGQVAANVVMFDDAATTPGSVTKYRVRGFDAAFPAVPAAFSNVATVTPEIAPSITQGPATMTTVNRGQPVTFTVQATGTLLRYQWRFGTTPIANAKAASYAISSAQTTHMGSYNCVVSNDVGTATSGNAMLTVNTPAAIPGNPVSATVIKGQSVSFTVTATGQPVPTVQWRKNQVALMGQTSPTLTFPTAQPGDVASYDCVVTNSLGTTTSKAAVLTVLGPPIITQSPLGGTVARGLPVTLTVTATGTATLTYQWRKGTVPITGATTNKLLLPSIRDTDAGLYDCVVSNAYGSTPSAAANLQLSVGTITDHRLVGARAGLAKWQWVQRLGGTGYDTVNALAIVEGKLLAGGYVGNATAKFGSITLTAPSYWTGRFSLATGAAEWVKGTGSVSSSGIRGIAGDGAGGVLSAGSTSSGAVYALQSLANGAITGTHSYGTGFNSIYGIVPGPGGVAYFIYRDATTSTLVKTLADGTVVWERQMRGGNLTASAIHISDTEIIFVCGGATANTLEFDNPSPAAATTITGGTVGTGFIVAYNSSGTVQWTRLHGSEIHGIAKGGTGSLVCAVTEFTSTVTASALIVDATTGIVNKSITNADAAALDAAVSTGGEVLLLMHHGMNGLSAGGYHRSSTNGCMLAKYSTAGDLLWLLPVPGDISPSRTARLVTAPDGRIYVALSLGSLTSAEFTGIAPFNMTGRDADGFIACATETPLIITPPASQIIALGDPLHLSVDVGGMTGTVSFQWLKDGKVLTGKTSSVLDIATTQLADAGGYTCKVTGTGGTVDSAKAVIDIVDTNARHVAAPLNKPLDMAAIVAGTGLTFTWWKNGVQVFNADGFSGCTTSKLHIATMGAAFADNYVCEVTGPAGTLNVPFTTSIMLKPVFTMVPAQSGIVSGSIDLQLSASEAASYKITNLPAGLVYNALTGRITGKPNGVSNNTITATATNAAGVSTPITFTLNVVGLQPYMSGGFQALAGRRSWNTDLGALVTFSVSSTGSVTGSLRTTSTPVSFTGRVDADLMGPTWVLNVRIARTGKPALLLNVGSPTVQDGALTGSLAEDDATPDSATLTGYQTVWSASRLNTFAGTFNATLDLPMGITTPPGTGTLKTVITSSTGSCAWSGKLSDTTGFSGSTFMWPTATLPVWTALYANYGGLMGTPTFSGVTQGGTIEWIRNPKVGSPSWAAFGLIVSGSKAP